MKCDTDLVLLYHYDELEPEQCKKTERHLETCAECRAFMKELEATSRAFSQMELPKPAPELIAETASRAREQLQTGPSLWLRLAEFFDLSPVLHPRLAMAASALALVIVVSTGSLYLRDIIDRTTPTVSLEWDDTFAEQLASLDTDLELQEWELLESSGVTVFDSEISELDNSLNNFSNQLSTF